jgi:alkyl sulfatase BDS1-like metallo-beta-lactamase superfamily hydrolase
MLVPTRFPHPVLSLVLLPAAIVLLAGSFVARAASPPRCATLQPLGPSPTTVWLNEKLQANLPFADAQDFEDARRGFIGTVPDLVVTADSGFKVYSLADYAFITDEPAPPSVNPSLWRQAQLNLINGLFRVTDGIYQVRSFDLSNMTIVEGNSGIIVIDPLSTVETARTALALYRQYRGDRPVVAVIYTHSHVDHFGGVRGVISDTDVDNGVRVLAPDGFLEAAVSENVMAGNAMTRRAAYFYGMGVPTGQRGQVDCGLGKANPMGTHTFIPPTVGDTITTSGETRSLDGVQIEFQLVSGTEAPAEMTLYFPQQKALDAAEIACPLLHNILTLRGAQVRDAKLWAQDLSSLIDKYGDRTDVIFAQHNWPTWGSDRIIPFLEDQRDLYAYLHDQTLRLTNQGYTGVEIAEMLKLPASLDKHWYTHGYYGTVSHNVKAIYQRYIGWYDGNPATLNALPPEQEGVKAVEYMGGADAVIEMACEDFQKGEYRWVAEVTSKVVFADPTNLRARFLEADALEQLAYQAEAGTWRNEYLAGAYELRYGILPSPGTGGSASLDTIKAMSMPLFFDYMGVRLNGDRAAGKRIVVNWTITYTSPARQETYALNLQNSALTYRSAWLSPTPDVSLALARSTLDAIMVGQTTFQLEIAAGRVTLQGDPTKLLQLMGLLDTFSPNFNIVTP